MIIETVDNTQVVKVRQSWLNDAMMCLERGRYGINLPDWNKGNDATVLGTSVHTAIERVLTAETSAVDILDQYPEILRELIATEDFKYMSMTDESMEAYGLAMVNAWRRDIMPKVKFGGRVEHKFNTHLTNVETPSGKNVEVRLIGTMDYIDPDGVIWDWKTAARKYSQLEKQKANIQSSVYALASHLMEDNPLPITFNFGVMTRANNSAGQVVPVQRTAAHCEWIKSQIQSVVRMGLSMGLENSWPQNDQGHLCSEKWCSWWSICKGSHLSEMENRWNPEEGQ